MIDCVIFRIILGSILVFIFFYRLYFKYNNYLFIGIIGKKNDKENVYVAYTLINLARKFSQHPSSHPFCSAYPCQGCWSWNPMAATQLP